MAIKNILLPLTGDPSGSAVARWGLDFAKRISAHISVGYEDDLGPVYFTPDAAPLAAYGMFYAHLQKLREDRYALARQYFDAAVAATKMPIVSGPTCARGSTMWLDSGNASTESFLDYAGLSDLVLLAAPGNTVAPSAWSVVDNVLFRKRRPALVVPEGASATTFSRPLVAWNGSAESANALRSALDLVVEDVKVTVLGVGKARPGRLPVAEAVGYLGWHCCASEVRALQDRPHETASIILEEAHRIGADSIVMGAYSHSRTRELLLGGVTDFILRHSDLPILMAH